MIHKKIEIPKDSYYRIMIQLGSIGSSIEFEDLNRDIIESLKPHYSIINRCDEIETIFNHMDDILKNDYNISYDIYNNYNDFKSHLDFELNKKKIAENNFLDHIQNVITKDENELKNQYEYNKGLLDSFHELLEKKIIYEKMVELFRGQIINEIKKEEDLDNEYYKYEEEEELMIKTDKKKLRKYSHDVPLYYLSGICEVEDVMKIRRIIFRGGKGRAIPSFYSITIDDNNIICDEKKYFNDKQIFLIVIQGKIVIEKIKKNLEVLNCETYGITNVSQMQKDLEYINNEISEQKKILVDIQKSVLNIVKKKTEPIRGLGRNYKSLYSLYRTFCKREKYIYINYSTKKTKKTH